MKTREKILLTSLEMFNSEGMLSVSTNHIADQMDISPGNLYYHFSNKEEIIIELFERFKKQMEALFLAPSDRAMDIDDTWLWLHLMFETIWEYRFLYRNLVNLTQKNRSLRIHFNHILRQKKHAAIVFCSNLAKAEILQADSTEIAALAENITLVSTYWLNYSTIRNNDSAMEDDSDISLAVYQVMSLVIPMLREPEKSQLKIFSAAYLN